MSVMLPVFTPGCDYVQCMYLDLFKLNLKKNEMRVLSTPCSKVK